MSLAELLWFLSCGGVHGVGGFRCLFPGVFVLKYHCCAAVWGLCAFWGESFLWLLLLDIAR